MKKPTIIVLAACTVVVSASYFVTAGPLEPPAGAPASTGKTTQELFDAISSLSSTPNGASRGPAIPGGNATGGQWTVSAWTGGGGNTFSTPIVGVRTGWGFTVLSGGSSGFRPQNVFTIVRNVSTGSATALRAIMQPRIGTMNVQVFGSAGTTTYDFTNTGIAGVRRVHVQRADGTFASLEEIDLLPSAGTLRITEPGGGTYSWNFATQTGAP